MEIIAHRGASKQHGDNTMISYKQASLLAVEAIEMDVCITKDSVLVMAHNAVDKETGVEVHNRNYREEELRLADVFTQFSGDTFTYLLDIKDQRMTSAICSSLCELCIRFSCLERCVFGSFSDTHLRDLCNFERTTGYTLQKALITSNMHADMFASKIDGFGLTHLVMYKYQVNEQLVSFCHSKGVKVYLYTCNTEGLEQYARSIGCDGIITDTPNQFRRTRV
ncbi:unnamed protein product [Pylaiella littoralis]